MKIALTGGTGFVGGHLARQLCESGHRVTLLSRSRLGVPDHLMWSLDHPPDPEPLRAFDLLIHCAWDLAATDDRNVAGSRRLYDAARSVGIPRVIFISSLSAFEGCRSRYGRSKLEVEALASRVGALNVRLGFVWDDSERGLSGGLKKLARLPVVPLPGDGEQRLFAICASDLGEALLRTVELSDAQPINLAHPEPLSLRRILESFAQEQGRHPIFLPVPWRLLWLPLRSMEAAGVRLRFRSDSLVSLMNQIQTPDFRALARIGTHLRPFTA